MPEQVTRAEFAQRIKAQYPAYANVPDDDLVTRMLDKYPVYRERVRDEQAPNSPQASAPYSPDAADFTAGVGKGVLKSVVGLGELVHRIPGVSRAVDAVYRQPGLSQAAFPAVTRGIDAIDAGTYGPVGETTERIGEFFLPVGAGGKVKAAAEIGKSALLTKTQGGTAGDVATAGAASAVIPGAGAVRVVGQKLAASAEPLVRAAIKPTVASLRRITGQGGMDAKANALVRFIIDNRLTTAEKARDMFLRAEHELQRVLNVRNAPTDAATRAARYLDALERSAARQGLGADDVALIRKAADDLVAGPMGAAVAGPAGTTRVLRADVPAREALQSARASSRWTTRKSWGEQKGATTEAAKAVERAQRDAVKVAVPETRALLQTEGKALQAEQALDRMAQRAANRDAVSLPAHVIAAGEVASGRVPVLAFAANWLRNNQMRAGIWADSLAKAIERGNAPLAADILKRLGVGSVSQMGRQPAMAQ